MAASPSHLHGMHACMQVAGTHNERSERADGPAGRRSGRGRGGGVSEQAGRCRAGGSRRIMAASPSHLNDRQAGMRACVVAGGRECSQACKRAVRQAGRQGGRQQDHGGITQPPEIERQAGWQAQKCS
jgi:hypothetical protein